MALQRNALARWSSRAEAARWRRQRGWPLVRISQKRTRPQGYFDRYDDGRDEESAEDEIEHYKKHDGIRASDYLEASTPRPGSSEAQSFDVDVPEHYSIDSKPGGPLLLQRN
ncbi:hypothetical protein TESG_08232 [Trichophyton tonsurans CBS 112818]|uniref:Uncharacterized protein n=1 Tax=Trichophyton tonsurans (strain CBS 112818) TaxID=647933 RepID=F2RMA0_TRIT1|nr:hypothetical protein TESG_08232 [Trichophyton tonsurans CBS 112818]